MSLLWNDDVAGDARFSPCGQYRYLLLRDLGLGKNVLFVMLNPSTADHESNDPTIARCLGFADRWGFGRLVVANLFAYRSTDPAGLKRAEDPVGPENDYFIVDAANEADLVIAAWGNHGDLLERDKEVLQMLPLPHCLGLTQRGMPRHPLYLPLPTLAKPILMEEYARSH